MSQDSLPSNVPNLNIAPLVKSAVDDYVKNDEFNEKLDGMLADARTELVTKSERTARNYALTASVLIFLLFTYFGSREYIDAKAKYTDIKATQADVRIKYAEALELTRRIEESLDALRVSVSETSGDVDTMDEKLDALESKAQSLSVDIERARSMMSETHKAR